MRYEEKTNRIGIESDDFFDFLEQIEAVTSEHHRATVDYWSKEKPFRAVIEWTESRKVPESISDKAELLGLDAKCGDCPHLERNGDKRRKWFPCKFHPYGTAKCEAAACDHYYITRLAE